MLRECKTNEDIRAIIGYIGNRYYQTPYLYVHTIKYGKGTEFSTTWVDCDSSGKLRGVFLLYYDCLHFFTVEEDTYPVEKILDAVALLSPRVVMVLDGIGQRLLPFMKDSFSLERNHVINMDKIGIASRSFESCIAARDDIEQIVQLMMSDAEYTSVYDESVLRQQLLARFDGNFSRYFVLYRDGKVVAMGGRFLRGDAERYPDLRSWAA